MGGSNSGRWHGSITKSAVEYCSSLDVNRWVREGIIKAGTYSSGRWIWSDRETGEDEYSLGFEVNTLDPSRPWIRLHYSFIRTNEDLDYRVRLQTTHPYFGGVRWWFTCPLLHRSGGSCNRRVVKLYLPRGGRYFGCRHCHNLTYRSCRLSRNRAIGALAGGSGFKPGEVIKILTGRMSEIKGFQQHRKRRRTSKP
jgi:hypothetical protein